MERKPFKRSENTSNTFWAMRLANNIKNNDRPYKILLVFMVGMILLGLLWFIIVQPIVSSLCFSPIEYSGLSIYESGAYMEFDDGEVFSIFISLLFFVEKCEITNFYYYDNKPRDNLFYGKEGDFYVLELQAESDYECIKKDIAEKSINNFTLDEYLGYEIKMQYEEINENNRFLIMFCDESKIVRCTYHTDDHNTDITSLISMFNTDCLLDWKA